MGDFFFCVCTCSRPVLSLQSGANASGMFDWVNVYVGGGAVASKSEGAGGRGEGQGLLTKRFFFFSSDKKGFTCCRWMYLGG